jgi:hypothetical protein
MLNRGDNSYNRIFYIDIEKDTMIRAFTQNAACQAGISEDGNYITGTYFGHTRGVVSAVNKITLGYKYVKPLPDLTVWQLRFNKFSDSLYSFVSLGTGKKKSTITNYISDSVIITVDSIELWDFYVPQVVSTAKEKKVDKKIKTDLFKAVDAVYDIRGKRVFQVNMKHARPGVYIQKSGNHFKRIVILR